MFKATLQYRILTTTTPLGEATGKNATRTLKSVTKTSTLSGGTYRLELFENDSPIFTAFGDTIQEAVDEALKMHKKSRNGGGR